jgi:hypothetical protein
MSLASILALCYSVMAIGFNPPIIVFGRFLENVGLIGQMM